MQCDPQAYLVGSDGSLGVGAIRVAVRILRPSPNRCLRGVHISCQLRRREWSERLGLDPWGVCSSVQSTHPNSLGSGIMVSLQSRDHLDNGLAHVVAYKGPYRCNVIGL